MLASVPFFVSAVLLAGFLGYRSYEEKKGFHAFDDIRRRFDVTVEAIYRKAVLGGIPKEWRFMVLSVLHRILHSIVLLSVDVLRAIERPLARLSYRMRMQAPASTGKEVSPFLKTITPEKKADGISTEGDV